MLALKTCLIEAWGLWFANQGRRSAMEEVEEATVGAAGAIARTTNAAERAATRGSR